MDDDPSDSPARLPDDASSTPAVDASDERPGDGSGGASGDGVADVTPRGDVVPVDLRDYVSFSLDEATRVRTLATDDLALDQWCIEPQQSTGVLQYAHADVVHTVLGGRAWFVTEQGEVGLDPLGALLVPAGTVHGIDNRGTDPLIVTSAMSSPDHLPVHVPDEPSGLALRDDAQHGRLGRALREQLGRLFGR